MAGGKKDKIDKLNSELKLLDKIREERKKLGEQSIEFLEAEAAYQEKNIEWHKLEGSLTEELLEHAQDINKALQERSRQLENVEQATKGVLEKTLLVNDAWRGGIVGALLDSEDKLGDITKALKKQVTVSNLLGTQFSNMAEMSLEVFKNSDAAAASIIKVTGGAGIGATAIGNLVKANMHLGVTFDELSGGFIALHTDFSNFHSLSKTQRNDLALHAAKLEQFGISASTTAQNMQDLTMVFGMTPDAAKATTEEFAQLAIALDMSIEGLTQNFREQMPVISKWGKKGIPMFKKMQIQARKLGVQLSTMVSVGDQFDTFEGAAGAVGKLNAMVGGDVLNAYDMMSMGIDERNDAVKRAVEMDGESWGSMNRMKQMAYANAAGISDMGEAHKLFGGASADSLSAEEKRVSQQMKSQKSLESAMTKTVTTLDTITNLLTKLFDSEGMRGLLLDLKGWLQYAVTNSDKIRSAFPWLLGGVGALQIAGPALGGMLGGGLMKGGMGMLGKLGTAAAGLVSMKGLLIAGGIAAAGYGAYKGYKYLTKPKDQSGTGGAVRKASGARSSTGDAETDRLAAALTVAINNAQGHDVVLKIDGNEIGRFTERYIGQKYKVR